MVLLSRFLFACLTRKLAAAWGETLAKISQSCVTNSVGNKLATPLGNDARLTIVAVKRKAIDMFSPIEEEGWSWLMRKEPSWFQVTPESTWTM
jgi:hypothetical protein